MASLETDTAVATTPRRRNGREQGRPLEGCPTSIRLLSQRIDIVTAPNLHHVQEGWVHEGPDGEEPTGHSHRAYGVYEEAPQRITLDDALEFERARETALHESLHACFAIVGLDNLIEGQVAGLSEHLIGTFSPVLLDMLRGNPEFVRYLTEVQP